MTIFVFILIFIFMNVWNELGGMFLNIPPVFQQPEVVAGLLAIAYAIESKTK